MNREALGKIIEENMGLVYKVVSHFYVSSYDRDDLIQAGLMGLQYAIVHFDEKLGNKLSTYAMPFIVRSVKKELENIKMIDDYIEKIELIVDKTTESNDEIDCFAIVNNLDEEMQIIYHMKFIDGFTEQKIAHCLNLNQSTISRKLKKIIKIIKEQKMKLEDDAI